MEFNVENLETEFSKDTIDLLYLAHQAGLVALQSREKGLEVSKDRAANGFVTSGDFDVNNFIMSKAALKFPGIGVLSEESPDQFNPEEFQKILIVDPIDGTRWYKDGGEIWSINLALVENNEIRSAVIFQPDLSVITFTEKGLGAFCQKGGKVTQIRTNPESDLSKVKVGIGTIFTEANSQDEISKLAQQLFIQSRGLNIMESSGCELAFIARGVSISAYIHPYAKPWDKAAGMLIIDEAGGVATGWPGKNALFENGVLAASTLALYDKISELVTRYEF